MVSKSFHRGRRARYASILKENTLEMFRSGLEKQENGDQNYPFLPDADFYYLTGFENPEAVLTACRYKGEVEFVLFIHRATAKEARWQGIDYNKTSVRALTGIRDVRYLDEMDAYLAKVRARKGEIRIRRTHSDLSFLRQVKTKEEIERHKLAAEITTEGVDAILQHLRPGLHEYEIEAYFDFVLKTRNAGHAFQTIAASGKNACVLHYSRNDRKMKAGDMILFDLGASVGHYACDLSRTYPVSGKFTRLQKRLYTAVLKGLLAAEEAAKPGYPKDQLQLLSKRIMTEELLRIGFIQKAKEIDRYYQHGSGHFIGLFTHDVGDPKAKLQPDMMFTLEPGLYFDELELGIRIEDTLLVTKRGVDVFTGRIPKEIDEIERIMKKRR